MLNKCRLQVWRGDRRVLSHARCVLACSGCASRQCARVVSHNLDQLLPTLNAVEIIANSIVVQNPPVEAANHALMPPTNDAVAMQVSEQNSAPNHDMQTPGYGQVVMTQTGALLLVTPQGCIPYTPSIVQVAEQPAPEISDATEADKEITAEVDHSIPTATSN